MCSQSSDSEIENDELKVEVTWRIKKIKCVFIYSYLFETRVSGLVLLASLCFSAF